MTDDATQKKDTAQRRRELKWLMFANEWSGEDVAHIAGVSRSTVFSWRCENTQYSIPADKLAILVAADAHSRTRVGRKTKRTSC